MKHDLLDAMVRGWFVGDFSPAVAHSSNFEVAVQRYPAGAKEAKHFHPVATEITAIVSGRALMFEREWKEGDILTISPGEATAFEALTDVVTVVVKIPSAKNDKVFVETGKP